MILKHISMLLNDIIVEYLLCLSSPRSRDFRAISREFVSTRAIMGLVLITLAKPSNTRAIHANGDRALNRVRAFRFNARIFLPLFCFIPLDILFARDIYVRYRTARFVRYIFPARQGEIAFHESQILRRIFKDHHRYPRRAHVRFLGRGGAGRIF